MFAAVMCVSGFDLLLAVYVKGFLSGSERVYGLIVSGLGAGAIIGGVWLMLRKRKGNAWQDFRLGLVLLSVLLGGFAAGTWLKSHWWLAAAMVALSFAGGIGNGLAQVQMETLVQEASPASQLGRIAGTLTSVGVGARIMTVLTVPLVVPSLLSVGWFFILSTVLLCLVAAILVPFRSPVLSKAIATD